VKSPELGSLAEHGKARRTKQSIKSGRRSSATVSASPSGANSPWPCHSSAQSAIADQSRTHGAARCHELVDTEAAGAAIGARQCGFGLREAVGGGHAGGVPDNRADRRAEVGLKRRLLAAVD